MSGVYALEPSTRGHLTLHTTHGAVSIALWPDCAPRATRAFIQRALNCDYDSTPFHRVVPNILVQAGDIGEVDPNSLVRVETHGRLKFRRRGLIALVGDEDNKCGSQFFITLASTPWLDGAHTIFGTIEGDTIFNALALAEVAAADSDEPPRVKSITVEDNPFPDITKLVRAVPKPMNEKDASNIGAVRNRLLLSFGDEDEEDEDDVNEKSKVGNCTNEEKSKQPTQSFPSAVPIIPKLTTDSANNVTHTEAESKEDKKATAQGEFARLLGLARKKKKKQSTSNPALSSKSATRSPTGVTKPVTGKERNGEDTIVLPSTRRRKRDTARETEVLRKLARFEKRLTAARNSENKESWFAEPLQLVGKKEPQADDVNEYIAVEGVPDDAR